MDLGGIIMVRESWILKNRNADLESISKKYGISQQIAKLIVNREILEEEQIDRYINSSYKFMHDGIAMKDMEKAVAILEEKIKDGSKIRIIGDYDVDGVISVFCLYKAFKELEANVDYEIPDRIKDGYGINENIIRLAYEDGVDTIITCDNGIAAIEQIKYAKELGLTVIVTDHHDVPFVETEKGRVFIPPDADAVLNPKQEDCAYEFKKICGAGVAFKLINKLYEKILRAQEKSYKFLEFVAIATVCDVVELTDENRVFVKKGLEMLNNSSNIGIKALKRESNLEGQKIGSYHLGFVIGPCINAAGRLDTAKRGLELLLCTDELLASEMASELVDINNTRKEMTSSGVDKCIEIIENTGLNKDDIIVVYENTIHESIAGIIAGRIKERYNKPTIVLTKAEQGAKGSARSIEEYNMFEGLNECKELLNKFGGHPMAAGMSLDTEKIDDLRKMLNKNSKLTEDDLVKKVKIDLSLPLNSISMSFIDEISLLEPFGTGNNKPVFGARNIKVVSARVIGKAKNMLKLTIFTGTKTMEAMLFNGMEEFEAKVREKYGEKELSSLYFRGSQNINMDFLFYPSINEWNGSKSIQIVISNFRMSNV